MTPDDDRSAAGTDEGQAGSDRSTSAADQAAADIDQTLADQDQQASDQDQQASDQDQQASDREQDARDQGGSDLDQVAKADRVNEQSRQAREDATRQRDLTALERARTTAARLMAAIQRDEVAGIRDLTAVLRDRGAVSRDRAADARDAAASARKTDATGDGLAWQVTLMIELLALGASDRQKAAAERSKAAADREAAAADRRRAAADRRDDGLDDLTGVFRRATGELALTHEIARARRSGRSLVLAIIDVDGLKVVNDTHGHAAGDALLQDVPAAITSTLRAYDVTVRWGGDEFVCALSEVSLEVARDRIAEIQRALAALRPGASISAGLAELLDDDTLESLIARADAVLYRAKSESRA
jgi:diguanylate cyclase (GGDEF)-like protein